MKDEDRFGLENPDGKPGNVGVFEGVFAGCGGPDRGKGKTHAVTPMALTILVPQSRHQLSTKANIQHLRSGCKYGDCVPLDLGDFTISYCIYLYLSRYCNRTRDTAASEKKRLPTLRVVNSCGVMGAFVSVSLDLFPKGEIGIANRVGLCPRVCRSFLIFFPALSRK